MRRRSAEGNPSRRVLATLALASVRFYQGALRPVNPWGCKFYPSCSNYALQALERHGLGRGTWLALKRLLRCRPGVFGGYDPVPGLSLEVPSASQPGPPVPAVGPLSRCSTPDTRTGEAVR